MSPIAHPAPARFCASLILRSIAVLAGLAVTTAPAQAEFVTQFAGLNYGQSPAGSYKWYQTSTQFANNDPDIKYVEYKPVDNYGNHHFLSFCIQRNVTMEPNPHEFDVVDLADAPDALPMGTTAANNIRRMWATWRSDLDMGSESVKNKKHSAFAHAIWFLLGQFDSDDNVPDGDNLGPTTKGYYLQYLQGWGTDLANLKALVGRYGHHKDDQDQIIEYCPPPPPGPDDVVPAPAALVLALTGIVPCLALRRRIFRKNAA
jgi:hypothetical protein